MSPFIFFFGITNSAPSWVFLQKDDRKEMSKRIMLIRHQENDVTHGGSLYFLEKLMEGFSLLEQLNA
jgi:hypothetical protein